MGKKTLRPKKKKKSKKSFDDDDYKHKRKVKELTNKYNQSEQLYSLNPGNRKNVCIFLCFFHDHDFSIGTNIHKKCGKNQF